jgi:hypothetical protein
VLYIITLFCLNYFCSSSDSTQSVYLRGLRDYSLRWLVV